MKLVARMHAVYLHLYERWMLFWARHAPKTNEHINDKPIIVAAAPGRANFCLYCLWTYMIWDDVSEMWTCPTCGVSCHPPLAITQKRPVVLPHVVSSQLVTLPEQRAVQPPRTPHVVARKEHFAVGQIGRKFSTGEIILVNGKPCYKNGKRIDTEQLPRVRRIG